MVKASDLEYWSSGIRHHHNSGEVVAELLDALGNPGHVLDLTFGQGVFWNTKRPEHLTANDLYSGRAEFQQDFRATYWPSEAFELVVFDPPFTAAGRPSDGTPGMARYGAERHQAGAPQNVHQVRELLVGGIAEACRLSSRWVLVKTQDVVEGGPLWPNVILALNTLVTHGFNIRAERAFSPSRRPQPSGQRVTGLGGRPSVFILAEIDQGNGSS